MSFLRETIELALCRPGHALEDAIDLALAERADTRRAEVEARALSQIDGTAALIGRLSRALPELPEAHREDVALALGDLADSIGIAAALAEGAREDRRGER